MVVAAGATMSLIWRRIRTAAVQFRTRRIERRGVNKNGIFGRQARRSTTSTAMSVGLVSAGGRNWLAANELLCFKGVSGPGLTAGRAARLLVLCYRISRQVGHRAFPVP